MDLYQPAERSDEGLTTGQLAIEKFAIGQAVPRVEDPMLLRGHGRYTDDVSLPGQAYAVMVRSRHGHGVIRAINTDAARKMPGVLAVYTSADLEGYGPLKCNMPLKSRDGSPLKKPRRGALAKDKVRYVGDPVACVIAETVFAAKDAAEAVEIDIDPLTAVVTPGEAAREGAPLLYDDVPGNIPLDFHFGDTAGGRCRLRGRCACHALEPPQQPRGGERDGAARRGRELRRRHALPFMSVRKASAACARRSPIAWASNRKRSMC